MGSSPSEQGRRRGHGNIMGRRRLKKLFHRNLYYSSAKVAFLDTLKACDVCPST